MSKRLFYDYFKEICAENGISPKLAAKEMGLSNSTVRKWKKRNAFVPTKELLKVSSFFHIPMATVIMRCDSCGSPKQPDNEGYYAGEVLNDETRHKRERRRENCRLYCYLFILDMTAFFIGTILMAFFKAFGFGGLLVAAVLVGLTALFCYLIKFGLTKL